MDDTRDDEFDDGLLDDKGLGSAFDDGDADPEDLGSTEEEDADLANLSIKDDLEDDLDS